MMKLKKHSVEPMKDGVYSIPSQIAAEGLRQWERTLILIGYFLDDRTLPFHLSERVGSNGTGVM